MGMYEEFKAEEEKYHNLYIKNNNILDELKSDTFKLAITKAQSIGIPSTYVWFKEQRDNHSKSYDKLGRNLANAYGLVVGKMWKYYKKAERKE